MNPMVVRAERQLQRRRQALTRLWRENVEDEEQAIMDRPADWPDAALERETAELLDQLSDRERAELREINAALKRMADGSFGKCLRCGGAVGRQRLLAIPEARYCVTCEQLVEQGH